MFQTCLGKSLEESCSPQRRIEDTSHLEIGTLVGVSPLTFLPPRMYQVSLKFCAAKFLSLISEFIEKTFP